VKLKNRGPLVGRFPQLLLESSESLLASRSLLSVRSQDGDHTVILGRLVHIWRKQGNRIFELERPHLLG